MASEVVTGWRYLFRVVTEKVNFLFTTTSRLALAKLTASYSMKRRCHQRHTSRNVNLRWYSCRQHDCKVAGGGFYR